ncbi:hypothetical protein LEP1GSC103_3208 [Leptospira borgpetersenii serovar Javanica str. UI 09931]|uniref:Uncharacterized protein n=2 Tax=Leptospira borgpetersenii TaxID=174 RepID=A0A0S2IRR9_LEPBO|nr:hypothetical protein LBBP_02094 [Leptospira borgpetersenii serovar Ballum]EKQ90774.1 hypothetical protein LEP1GSC101_0644 [Leptospira borgpetersenii str. UI 09149]EKR00108.1 hypothetical protein LEP1GSC121_3808 [Leptospira borgpetersenii serovar Castellonis str. 200801910]EMK14851.1 hypothetical protein LEP1GSC066_1008 [Leptospira sp. serovar Kenya str. Sh9]EMN58799.1 hypothetical protein LEP1GSC090_1039 [Leptospira borgpetersenii serovar Javanica str. MK146]EMO11679.1 hypothetical protein 
MDKPKRKRKTFFIYFDNDRVLENEFSICLRTRLKTLGM